MIVRTIIFLILCVKYIMDNVNMITIVLRKSKEKPPMMLTIIVTFIGGFKFTNLFMMLALLNPTINIAIESRNCINVKSDHKGPNAGDGGNNVDMNPN